MSDRYLYTIGKFLDSIIEYCNKHYSSEAEMMLNEVPKNIKDEINSLYSTYKSNYERKCY